MSAWLYPCETCCNDYPKMVQFIAVFATISPAAVSRIPDTCILI